MILEPEDMVEVLFLVSKITMVEALPTILLGALEERKGVLSLIKTTFQDHSVPTSTMLNNTLVHFWAMSERNAVLSSMQITFLGSFITNINNPIGFGRFGARGYGGVAFLGQQNYNAGSLGNNFAGGIWKKEKEDYFSSKLTFRIIRYQYQ